VSVSDLFFNNTDVLSDAKGADDDILRQIIHDVEMSVRRELAERLADAKQAPHELILALANDEIEVAHPLLIQSDILHDFDLVEIIHHRTLEHQLAIAMRKTLNESVTDALVEAGNEDVVAKMIENPNARISKSTMEYLVDQSKRVDTYQNPLLKRPDLEPDLARKCIGGLRRIASAYREEQDRRSQSRRFRSTVKNVIDRIDTTSGGESSKPANLAERLSEEGEVTPRMLVQVLRQGEVPLFEAMFSKMSGLRPRLLRRMLFEPGGEALAILCKRQQQKPDFAVSYAQPKARNARAWQNPQGGSSSSAVRSHAGCRRCTQEKWQRDSNFLNAIRVVETAGARVMVISSGPSRPMLRSMPVGQRTGQQQLRGGSSAALPGSHNINNGPPMYVASLGGIKYANQQYRHLQG
jgi:uncharacterized protein (DUF2336 family)